MTVSVNANLIFARRRVGEELQRLRVASGLKQDDAAAKLGVSRFTVSKIERGKAFPSADQLRTLLKAYRASAEERAAILAQIEQAKSYGRAWWEESQFQSLNQGDWYRYFSLEDAAERITVHAGPYVPGLLQTREYVEALAAFGQKSESAERREAFVEARLRRQGILTRRNPVMLEALCGESALRAIVGGRDVMQRQLQHLLAEVRQQNISLRVIPFEVGAPSISGYPFTILDFPGTDIRSVVSQEMIGGERITDDPVQVRWSRRQLIDRAQHSLDQEQTIRRIEEIAKELR